MKILLFDLSRTLLFPVDENYKGELNKLHKDLSSELDYNFLEHFRLDKSIMSYLKTIKNKYGLYLFTSGSIQNVPEIKIRLDKTFKKIYSSEDIGLTKKDPKSYEYISADIGVNLDEMLFIDDSEDNINTAKNTGLKVCQFKENNQVISRIDSLR